MKALRIYAGPAARAHIERQGLRPEDVAVVAAAAGGPKGLILGPLDRYIFGDWLRRSSQSVDLLGASIGGWRMATACLHDPVAAFERLEHDYIHQNYALQPGQKRVTPEQVSASFAEALQAFYGGRLSEVLQHPRYRLHLLAARGRKILRRESPWRTPLGLGAAYLSNALKRRALGHWLQRSVFSVAQAGGGALSPMPFDTGDFSTRQQALTEANFLPVLQASCAIPFVLRSVQDIPGAQAGAYWDGGLTDYHLHLRYQPPREGLVLYPHFQQNLIPGWLDKALPWRHPATAALDRVLVLAPDPQWLQTLPGGKLPDRSDFMRYQGRFEERVKIWTRAVGLAQQLVEDWHAWLHSPQPAQHVRAL